MQIKSALILLPFLCSGVLAAPLTERAAARSFAELTISNGVAGNASAEALAKLPAGINLKDLKATSAADLATLEAERKTAEDAETDSFNSAVAAASGANATALQNGKIKNKVLKLTFEVTGLQIQMAQGKDTQAKIAEEQKKLTTNIDLDVKAKGQASKTVVFTGS